MLGNKVDDGLQLETTRMRMRRSAMSVIEVEKHFTVGPETRSKLTALGAKLTLREEFTDIYYDTAAHKLMTSSHWLRQRNGEWQLKYPVISDNEAVIQGQPSRTECNYELVEEATIIKQLRTVIVIEGAPSLNQLVHPLGVLVPVAEFSTVREGWAWPDGRMGERVSIELDEASFNYAIGSVEVLVGGADQVTAAEEKAREIAGKIGQYYD